MECEVTVHKIKKKKKKKKTPRVSVLWQISKRTMGLEELTDGAGVNSAHERQEFLAGCQLP
jgi:hypothetical protein